jgi:hypothetical protein
MGKVIVEIPRPQHSLCVSSNEVNSVAERL